jgi:hypothetical protein
MNRHAYLLVLLVIWAQVDDFWAAPLVSPSAPVAVDDDDEYLPSQRRLYEECSPRQEPVFAGLKPHTADFPLVRRGVSSEWDLTAPFTPPPLYAFLSLQI